MYKGNNIPSKQSPSSSRWRSVRSIWSWSSSGAL